MSSKNNSIPGFTLQRTICDMYGIVPESKRAKANFKKNYDPELSKRMQPCIKKAFAEIGSKPVSCHTQQKVDGDPVPYNFTLQDGSTLSVRTNVKGSKVAPRGVGQAGYEKLNEYFSDIYGRSIRTRDDIKHLIIEHVDEVLPVFIDNLMDADHILWVHLEGGKFLYDLFDGNGTFNIEFSPENFHFTSGLGKWNDSTTLKYKERSKEKSKKDQSIAEIQVHKNRSGIKFRFIMDNMLPLIREAKANNETLGMTAELSICGEFELDFPEDMRERGSYTIAAKLEKPIHEAFKKLPRPVRYTGNEKGKRGKRSKCPYDFVLEGDKTLSLKTNYGKMVCPPEVGQPGAETCYMYFKDFIEGDEVTEETFKRMVLDHVQDIIPIYLSHLFDSDYLLRIRESPPRSGTYVHTIIRKGTGARFHWDPSRFSFTQPTMKDWNESNTVRYDGISLGEFQVHKNRNCYKFRFNFDNLLKILGTV